MRHILTAFMFLLAVTAAAEGVEINTDRPGLDYRSFDIGETNPGPCERACAGETQCRAWTYVRPGIQGPNARCWLKSAVPQAYTNDCCISGVAGEDAQTTEAREVQSLLATLGYDPGQIDGKPGRQTRDAIRRFQAEHGLPADGRIGPAVIKGLWALATTKDADTSATPADKDRPVPPAPQTAVPQAPAVSTQPVQPAEDLSGLSTLD